MDHEQREAGGEVTQYLRVNVAARIVRYPADIIAASMQHPDAAEPFVDGARRQGERYAEADAGEFGPFMVNPVLLQ